MCESDILRQRADRIEHDCEFNVNRTARWSQARQRENDAKIWQARALRDQADQLDNR